MYYKTPAEAFVGKLYVFYDKLQSKNIHQKEETRKQLDEFCDNWKKDYGLRPGEADNLLDLALIFAKNKKAKKNITAETEHDYSKVISLIKHLQNGDQRNPDDQVFSSI